MVTTDDVITAILGQQHNGLFNHTKILLWSLFDFWPFSSKVLTVKNLKTGTIHLNMSFNNVEILPFKTQVMIVFFSAVLIQNLFFYINF